MINLILQFLPLAAAAIAPLMILAVILLLSSEKGLAKATSFILGRIICYTAWSIAFFYLFDRLSGSDSGPSTSKLIINIVLGALLLLLAVKNIFKKNNPDAPPPKWMRKLDKAKTGALFGLVFGLSIIQIRYVILIMAGVTLINETQIPQGQLVIAYIILIFFVIWPQLIPIILYLILGNRAHKILSSLRTWLVNNQKIVNIIVLVLFGIVLLWKGISGLLI